MSLKVARYDRLLHQYACVTNYSVGFKMLTTEWKDAKIIF